MDEEQIRKLAQKIAKEWFNAEGTRPFADVAVLVNRLSQIIADAIRTALASTQEQPRPEQGDKPDRISICQTQLAAACEALERYAVSAEPSKADQALAEIGRIGDTT